MNLETTVRITQSNGATEKSRHFIRSGIHRNGEYRKGFSKKILDYLYSVAQLLRVSNAFYSMKHVFVTIALLLATGCSTTMPPLKTVDRVDIKRFMGPWYVIACIPTFIETEAYNGVETYRLEPDGSIDTVFTFNKGSFDGPVKQYNPRGFHRGHGQQLHLGHAVHLAVQIGIPYHPSRP